MRSVHRRWIPSAAWAARLALIGAGALAPGATAGDLTCIATIPLLTSVRDVVVDGHRLLVITSEGLHQVDVARDRAEVKPISPSISASHIDRLANGTIIAYSDSNPPDIWLKGPNEQNFRAVPKSDTQGTAIGYMTDATGDGTTVFLGTSSGLFRLSEHDGTLQRLEAAGERILSLAVLDGTLYAGREQGIVRQLPDSHFENVPGLDSDSYTTVTKAGAILLIRQQHLTSRNGFDPAKLFVISRSNASPQPARGLSGDFDFFVHPVMFNGRALITLSRELFEYDAATGQFRPFNDLPQLPDGKILFPDGNKIFQVARLDGTDLAVSANGNFFALRKNKWALIPIIEPPNNLFVVGDQVFVKTLGGQLHQGVSQPWSDAVTRADMRHLSKAQPGVALEFTVRHPCASYLKQDTLMIQAVAAHTKTVTGKIYGAETLTDAIVGTPSIRIHTVFDFDAPGPWSFVFSTVPGGERIAELHDNLTFEDRSWAEWFDEVGKYWSAAFLVLYFGFFAAAFVGARWWGWCRRVITDSYASRIAWPYFLLRQVPFFQRWVFTPYHTAARDRCAESQFLELPVLDGKTGVAESSSLLDLLATRRRLWLQGNTGMGKSAVFNHWRFNYFCSTPNLAAAVVRFRFIPIFISVRKYADLPLDPNNPELWVIEAARRSLLEMDFAIGDNSLFEAMFRSGDFALILDGMNEADRDGAIQRLATEFPRLRLLITSQTEGFEPFELFRLPRDVTSYLETFIGCYRDPQVAASLARKIRQSRLLAELRSFYDVRLLIDLHAQDGAFELPQDRIGLYRAVLSRAKADDGTPMDLRALKSKAWEMVRGQPKRYLDADDDQGLPKNLLEKLARDEIRILRRTGDQYEFRHDQMRTYLAASHLLENSPGVEALAQRLDESDIWKMDGMQKKEQDELWTFLASMLNDCADIERMWRMSSSDPERRSLTDALQWRAQTLECTLTLPPKQRGAKRVRT